MTNAAARLASCADFMLAGVACTPDISGALWIESEGALVVADLHFEKGSFYAERRTHLPPFDTATTLMRLGAVITRYNPRVVIALGDSFHDARADSRMHGNDRDALRALMAGRDWVWVAGNHDPAPPEGLGGEATEEWRIGSIVLKHAPSHSDAFDSLSPPREAKRREGLGEGPGEPSTIPDVLQLDMFDVALAHKIEMRQSLRKSEQFARISGHLHPVARVVSSFGSTRRKCFIEDGERCILPSFGAYTGGLNILDEAFNGLFSGVARVHAIGREKIYRVPIQNCAPD